MLGPISPFFIVDDVPEAVRFYTEQLGFDVRFSIPEKDPFFAIVGRDLVQIFLKAIADTVGPQPNHTRHEWAPWDASVHVDDPDALAAEFAAQGVTFHQPPGERDDGLRGFEVRDRDGYVLFFGHPQRDPGSKGA
ncbi:MAG: VOC family protein [Planctomycetota bacterium]|nr:VOC family protein [Planctomycetota bacterium]